jgi:hypothetical protein
MNTITIKLGGQGYEIRQLPLGASRKWREKFAEPLEKLLNAVQASAVILRQALSRDEQVNAGELVGVLGQTLLGGIGQVLLGSMDTILEMVFAYAPYLQAQRAEIEENAYDDEVMAAFVEVLKLAYPFGQIVNLVKPGPQVKLIKKS